MTPVPAIETLREAFGRTKITVVGDVMSDEYVWGECTRISPEAPVPVVTVDRRTSVPGGAANVAMGIVALGGRAGLVGVVGDDEVGRQLAEVLRGREIDPGGLVVDASRPTTAKTRIIAGAQQVVRADIESSAALDDKTTRHLLDRVEERLAGAHAVVLSDYAKGVVTREVAQAVIALAKKRNLPVVVDPKGTGYERFQGATLVTPNVHEAERATGLDLHKEEELHRAGWLLSEVVSGAVLITRGAHGMTLFDPAVGVPVDFPARAKAVFDVTGAGDTVVAILSVSLGCMFGFEVGAHLATAGAAAVIAKVGTATASLEDIAANS